MAYTLSTLRAESKASLGNRHCVGGCEAAAHLQHSFGNDFVVSPIVAAAPTTAGPPAPTPPPPPPVPSHTCNASTTPNGLDCKGSDLEHIATPTATACATACCANVQCSGYVFDPKQGDSSGEPICHTGKPCCWLKHGSTQTFSHVPRFTAAAFPSNSPPPPPPPPSTGETEWPLWVPPGQWVEWFGGAVHTGPTIIVRNYSQTEIPLLVRAGAIVPMKGLDAQKQIAPERLKLEVVWVAGVNGSGAVYEDVGDSLDYQRGVYSLTNLSLAIGESLTTLKAEGGQIVLGLPTQRRFEVRFRGAPSSVDGGVPACCLPC